MVNSDYSKYPTDEDLTRVHKLGLDIIAEHNKYTNYTDTQVWAVGLGSLVSNYDVRYYDPDEYSGVMLLVLALQDKFRDIGGTGVHAPEYIELLKRYYKDTSESILNLSIVSKMSDNPLTPVVITDKYHPPLLRLYIKAVNDIKGEKSICTDEELDWIRDKIVSEISNLMFNILSM